MAKVIQLLKELDQLQKKAINEIHSKIVDAKYSDERKDRELESLDSHLTTLSEEIDKKRAEFNMEMKRLKEATEILKVFERKVV